MSVCDPPKLPSPCAELCCISIDQGEADAGHPGGKFDGCALFARLWAPANVLLRALVSQIIVLSPQ